MDKPIIDDLLPEIKNRAVDFVLDNSRYLAFTVENVLLIETAMLCGAAAATSRQAFEE